MTQGILFAIAALHIGSKFSLKNLQLLISAFTRLSAHIDDILYGRVIYINNEWFLKEFTMEPKTRNYERF